MHLGYAQSMLSMLSSGRVVFLDFVSLALLCCLALHGPVRGRQSSHLPVDFWMNMHDMLHDNGEKNAISEIICIYSAWSFTVVKVFTYQTYPSIACLQSAHCNLVKLRNGSRQGPVPLQQGFLHHDSPRDAVLQQDPSIIDTCDLFGALDQD